MSDEGLESSAGPGFDDDDDLWAAAAAHEIRAPLLAVKAALESVLTGGEGVDPRRLLERSLAEIEHLAGAVEDVVRWAVGARAIRRRPTDVAALAAETVSELASGPEGDRVLVHAAAASLSADVDVEHLRIALSNLVRNGLAYGQPGTKVEVAVAPEGDDALLIRVTNRGSGPLEGTSLFAPGLRVDVEARNPGGRGLGLFIVRRVVEAHGGTVWFESSGGETTFVVRLPRLPI